MANSSHGEFVSESRGTRAPNTSTMTFQPGPKNRGWLRKVSLTGVYFVVCAAFLIWVLNESALPRSLDNLAYDACLRSVSRMVDVPERVLLLTLDPQSANSASRDEEILQAVTKLSQLNARTIGITFPVDESLASRLRSIHRQTALVSGNARPDDALRGSGEFLRPMNGVYRDHYCLQPRTGKWSLEAAIAKSILLDPSQLPDSQYRIFFRGIANTLPHVRIDDVLQGKLTEDLVAGKAILVGYSASAGAPRWSVPTTNYAIGMTPLEVRGHALNTLLADRPVNCASRSITLLLFMAVALFGQFVFRRVNARLAAATYVALLAAVGGAAWILLAWLQIWIPCVPLAAILTYCFAVAAEMRLRVAGDALRMILLRRGKTKERPADLDEYEVVDDPWTDLVDLTYQMFYLRRLVILELPPGRDHLVPVKFVNCTSANIAERRRDYRRSPFTDAFKAGVSQPNNSRQFFLHDDPNEIEFLVPLLFGGQVVGFLAVTLMAKVLDESPEFSKELDSLAKEISLLIAQYRSQTIERKSNFSLAGRLVQRVPEEELLVRLEHVEKTATRRTALLDKVFQSSETASAIYDAFGQLVVMNRAMFRTLQERGAIPAQLTALEAMTFLTRHETPDCRQKLRRAIIDTRQQAILIAGKEDVASSILHVRPVNSGVLNSISADPFEVQGIHFELVDTSVLNQIQGAKKRLADNVFGKLKNDLGDLKLAVEKMNAAELETQELEALRKQVVRELSSSISTVSSYRGYLSKKASNDAGEYLPVEAVSILRSSVRAVRQEAAQRDVRLNIELPEDEFDVLANPHLLRVAFEQTLRWLVEYARDDTELRVTCDDAITEFVVTYYSENGGSATERLKECLTGDRSTDADEFRRLRELRDWFERWGSRLAIQSEPGLGMKVTMHLKRHSWTPSSLFENQSLTEGPKNGTKVKRPEANEGRDA